MKWQNTYGQVVRIGPKHISISSKEMLKQVLQKDDIAKGPAYERLHCKCCYLGMKGREY